MRSRTLGVALAAVVATASAVFAQGPLQQRAHYTINVPHELQMGGYVLPPGRYELFQVNTTDLTLFSLHPEDNTHSPLALIRTTRVLPASGEPPAGDAKIRLDIDEESADGATPVLRGWTVPGQDGYEIIAVDAKDEKLVRVR